MDEMKREEQGSYVGRVTIDDDPVNPRKEYDCFGKMVCLHSRYDLGDEKLNREYRNVSRWELEERLKADFDIAVLLPIHLYDHSGLTINTTGFACPWDSGQIGFIFATKEDVRKEFGEKITKAALEKAEKILLGEVETYDQYLQGEIYCYDIEKNGETIDSLCGMFGLEYAEQQMREALDHWATTASNVEK
ncbi:MAG: hypothetical protein Q8K86_05040 [Candidatus Nanopelagicaceae bacterium]|nr:hypothetical protein [Candidatus Nanopelagicaceae bacterium]